MPSLSELTSFYFCSFNCFSRAAALARSRSSGAVPPSWWLLALFAFPQTVTLQGTIESRKVSHYRCTLFVSPRPHVSAMNFASLQLERECAMSITDRGDTLKFQRASKLWPWVIFPKKSVVMQIETIVSIALVSTENPVQISMGKWRKKERKIDRQTDRQTEASAVTIRRLRWHIFTAHVDVKPHVVIWIKIFSYKLSLLHS